MEKRPVYYSQVDPRWRNRRYAVGKGTGTIGTSGCGPTTAAMIVATWVDPCVTPVELAAWAVEHGYRTENNGTYRSLFYGVGDHWGLRYRETWDAGAVLECLREGGMVACHVGPGRWTRGGHYILCWGCDGTHVAINDPSGDTAARNRGTLAELMACRKAFVCFWPPEKKEEIDVSRDELKEVVGEVLREELPKALAQMKPEETEEGPVVYTTLEEVPAWARDVVERAMGTPCAKDPGRMMIRGDEQGRLHLTIDNLITLQLLDNLGMLG